MNEELLKAIKSLLNDIEAMRIEYAGDDCWFGGFSEYNVDEDGWETSAKIEWPNLAISCDKIEELMEQEGLA